MTMRDCADGELRDRLPDFVHGTLAAAEQVRVGAHVASCEDCAAEVGLLRAVREAFPAPVVDVRRIVAGLPPATRQPARRPAYVERPWRLAAAATVLLVAGLSLAVVTGTFFAAGHRPAGLSFDGGPSGLSDQQVQSLLSEIDALDTKPNAEPDSPVGHIVPVREGDYNES